MIVFSIFPSKLLTKQLKNGRIDRQTLKVIYLPVAQLDSASDSDSEGRRFESYRVGQNKTDSLRVGFCFYISQRATYFLSVAKE